jgi:hypothetical protein
MTREMYVEIQSIVLKLNDANENIRREQYKISEAILELSKVIMCIPQDEKYKCSMKVEAGRIFFSYDAGQQKIML